MAVQSAVSFLFHPISPPAAVAAARAASVTPMELFSLLAAWLLAAAVDAVAALLWNVRMEVDERQTDAVVNVRRGVEATDGETNVARRPWTARRSAADEAVMVDAGGFTVFIMNWRLNEGRGWLGLFSCGHCVCLVDVYFCKISRSAWYQFHSWFGSVTSITRYQKIFKDMCNLSINTSFLKKSLVSSCRF